MSQQKNYNKTEGYIICLDLLNLPILDNKDCSKGGNAHDHNGPTQD